MFTTDPHFFELATLCHPFARTYGCKGGRPLFSKKFFDTFWRPRIPPPGNHKSSDKRSTPCWIQPVFFLSFHTTPLFWCLWIALNNIHDISRRSERCIRLPILHLCDSYCNRENYGKPRNRIFPAQSVRDLRKSAMSTNSITPANTADARG